MTNQAAIHVVLHTEHELVLIKPAGMSCELPNDTRGVSLIECVRQGRIERLPVFPEAKLPHRLDRVACGYVVVALTDKSIVHHNAQIAANAWAKWYIARVAGDARHLVGEHKAYIKRKGKRAELVRAGGQPARLDILEASPSPRHEHQSHVLIRLHTGRYHQIRAMCAGLGVPLVGDDLYGGPRGTMYLEHAALQCVLYNSERMTFFNPNDPVREPIAPAMLSLLGKQLEIE